MPNSPSRSSRSVRLDKLQAEKSNWVSRARLAAGLAAGLALSTSSAFAQQPSSYPLPPIQGGQSNGQYQSPVQPAVVQGRSDSSATRTASGLVNPRTSIRMPIGNMPTDAGRLQINPVLGDTMNLQATDSELKVYDLPLEMVGPVSAQLQMQYSAQPSVKITTEPNTGRLMVMGSERAQAQITQQVEQIRQRIAASNPGQPLKNVGIQQRSYQLRNSTPLTVETAIRRLAGPRMTVTTTGNDDLAQFRIAGSQGMQDVLQVDRRAGLVTVQGSSRHIAAWLQIVAAIDSPVIDGDIPPLILPLATAKPRTVQKALQLVSMNLQSEGDEQVTNTMPLGDDDQVTGIASLEGGGEGGLMGDVQIEFVEALGIAILKGPKRDVERVQEVIKSIIDQSSKTQPEIEVVPLQHVNSEAVSTVVKQLYEEVLAARQGQVSITPLVQPNSLLLIGRAEAILSLKDLLSKLDQPLDPTSQLRVFRLLYASATDASETIDQFFQTAEGTDAPVGLATRVSVVPDFRTNSLIVQASPRDLAEVSRLISEIDVENTAAESAVRVFPLKNALAEELEPVLQAAIGASNQDDGDARPPSNKIVIKTLNGTDLDSGILSGVVVTANPSINSLVVRAPSSSMPLIAELISQLDQLPGAEALIKVFTVENADATTLAQTVQQLFGLAQTAGNNSTGGIFGGNNSAAAAISALSAGGESSLVQLRVAVDARTNSIIVSGSPSDLEVIEVLLLRLDEDAVEERRSQVVWLRNSNAVDIATAIQQFVVNQLQNVQQSTFQGQSLRPDEQFGREILVQAEPSTNSLIVSATPRYIDEVMEIIRRLDRRPPMIHVEVLLAEVTLDDTFEFGVEWGLQDALLFDRGSATGGTLGSPAFNIGAPLTNLVTAGQPSQAAGQGISSFALGRTNSTLGYGGLVLSAASDSISALLRTLQDANRLQILSRPSVTTVDNVEGFVQVGAQVPRIQNVTPGNQFAGQSISIEDVNIGLILRILPRTNEDGLILLNVSIERSSLRNDDTGIPVGFGPDGEVIRSPIINTTRATSRISAYDGQTVVYAGLISKARTSRTRRIPFLADIPLAGALFRFDTETESRTELLVVLTPRIINSDVALDTMNQVESSRMSWCLADVLNIHGDTSLSPGNGLWGPAASPVIYPDLQPTVMGEEIIPDSVFIGDAQTVAPNGMMSPNGVEPLNIPQINSYPNYSPGGMIPNANRSGSNGSLLEQPAINEAPEFTPPNY